MRRTRPRGDPRRSTEPQSRVVAAARGPLQQVVDSTARGEYIPLFTFKLRLTQKSSQLTGPYRDGDDRSFPFYFRIFISFP